MGGWYNQPVEFTYSLGYWIRRRRKLLDLTQRALAEKVGCALVTMKKIELDERRPSDIMSRRIADSLGLDGEERKVFLSCTRGDLPVDRLPLPTVLSSPAAEKDRYPRLLTPLIGREEEIQDVLTLLHNPEIRSITIVGVGGTGKTKLALAVAAALRLESPYDYPDGIIFVDLSPLSKPEHLVLSLAAALQFPLNISSRDQRSPEKQVIDYLSKRQILLILDNFENILPAVYWLGELLQSATGVDLIITSRERLKVTWEQLFPLQGLRYLDNETENSGRAGASEDNLEHPSAQLFISRAKRILPSYRVANQEIPDLNQICALVAGIPLALELAASLVDKMTLAEIASEIKQDYQLLEGDWVDLPSRQQSMQAIWNATWKRLSATEQRVFANLCLFRGGFSIEAARMVANASTDDLASLSENYLITLDPDHSRYYVHEMIRQFGEKKLENWGQKVEAQQKHLEYYLHLGKVAKVQLHGSRQSEWLTRLDAERDNLRLALSSALVLPEKTDLFVELAEGINWYWRIRSLVTEWSSWLDSALASPKISKPAQARLLYYVGHMAWMRGDFLKAQEYHLASLSIWKSLGLETGKDIAQVWHGLGMAAHRQGNAENARSYFEHSLQLYRSDEDAWGTAFTQSWLAMAYRAVGDEHLAYETASAAKKATRALGDPWLSGIVTANFAEIAWELGKLQEAEKLALEAITYNRSTGHLHSVAHILVLLSRVMVALQRPRDSRDYCEQAFDLYYQMGNAQYAAEVFGILAEDRTKEIYDKAADTRTHHREG